MESDSLHEYDKSWKAFFITTLFILCTVNAYAQSSDTIFSRYFRYAQNFADAYPREKVSLHWIMQVITLVIRFGSKRM